MKLRYCLCKSQLYEIGLCDRCCVNPAISRLSSTASTILGDNSVSRSKRDISWADLLRSGHSSIKAYVPPPAAAAGYARAIALTRVLSTRGRAGLIAEPCGATTAFLPPLLWLASWQANRRSAAVRADCGRSGHAAFPSASGRRRSPARRWPSQPVCHQSEQDAIDAHLDQQLHDARLPGREEFVPQRIKLQQSLPDFVFVDAALLPHHFQLATMISGVRSRCHNWSISAVLLSADRTCIPALFQNRLADTHTIAAVMAWAISSSLVAPTVAPAALCPIASALRARPFAHNSPIISRIPSELTSVWAPGAGGGVVSGRGVVWAHKLRGRRGGYELAPRYHRLLPCWIGRCVNIKLPSQRRTPVVAL